MTAAALSARGVSALLRNQTQREVLTPLHESLRQQGLRLVTANAGDHPAILSFLQSVHFQPSAAEFLAQSDHPTYEPSDRLLVRDRSRIAGHVRITRREMHFGGLRFPTVCLSDMAVASPFRGQGLGAALLQEAERRAQADGAVIATLMTKRPEEYLAHDWLRCGGQTHSTAGTRDILSSIHSYESQNRKPALLPTDETETELNIRLWRHVEEDALVHLRQLHAPNGFGWTARNAEYWRWLVSRRGYDRIYVAIRGHAKLELNESLDAIVGYAVMREGRILELITLPERDDIAVQLLGRTCLDAIERDIDRVRFDAPANHPLHDLIEAADGKRAEGPTTDDSTTLAKIFNPVWFMQQLAPLIHLRAKASDLSLPTELGLCVDGEKRQLVLTRRSAKFEKGKLGRSYITCSNIGLTQLLLGGVPIDSLVENGHVTPSTKVAQQMASIIFPRLALWFPTFDEVPSVI